MNLFTKLSIATLITGAALTANAQALGNAQIINPYPPAEYQTFLSAVTVSYDFTMITIADYDLMVLVEINGKPYEVYADVYFDPEVGFELGQTPENIFWGNELVIDFSDEAYGDGYPVGKYTITIPEGLVMDAKGNTNPEQEINFVKVDPVSPVSISPSDGMYPAQDLKNITVTFNDDIVLNQDRSKIEIRKKDDWLSDPYYLEDYKISEDGKSLLFDLSFLDLGVEYSVNIPMGFVHLGQYHINSEIWMYYTNWDGMDQATLISAPELESSILKVNPFILTWDYQTITMTDEAPETEFVCGYPDYGAQDGWRTWIPADYYELVHVAKDGTVSMTPTADLPANAIYLDVTDLTEDDPGYVFEIFFPAGLVKNAEGKINPPLSYKFSVWNLWIDPEVTAENGIIFMEWPYAEWATYNLSDEEVTLQGENGKEYVLEYNFGGTYPGQVGLENNNYHGLVIDLNDLNLTNGNYKLVVPKGYIYLTDPSDNIVLNDIMVYEFSWLDGDFAGINSIISSQIENNKIYDLQGRKITEDNDVRNLKKGIYIINGKKIMVK